MRLQLSRPTSPPSMQSPTGTTGPPGLWHSLDPARRQQLAQCLAELIQRMRCSDMTPPEEADDHERS
jgi:hypothetical protein